jgi:hypothetical protein
VVGAATDFARSAGGAVAAQSNCLKFEQEDYGPKGAVLCGGTMTDSKTAAAEITRRAPRRFLDKQEATRHLMHGAIRLVMSKEDPFIVHLAVHSAEKLLSDVAKSRGLYLHLDWELYITDEHHKEFFGRHCETYNYFKHADRDSADQLPVHDIMMLNVMALFMVVVNYAKLYNVFTDHMRIYIGFSQLLMPNVLSLSEEQKRVAAESLFSAGNLTPAEFFAATRAHPELIAPNLLIEKIQDLGDILDFYRTPFDELHRKRKSPTRVNAIPRAHEAAK